MKCDRSGAPCPTIERCEVLGCQWSPPLITIEPDPTTAAGKPLGAFDRLMLRAHETIERIAHKHIPSAPPMPAHPLVLELTEEMEVTMSDPTAGNPGNAYPAAYTAAQTAAQSADPGASREMTLAEMQSTRLPAPSALAGLRPFAPAAALPVKQRDVRVVSVATGGFVFIEDNAPVGVSETVERAGDALVRLLRA